MGYIWGREENLVFFYIHVRFAIFKNRDAGKIFDKWISIHNVAQKWSWEHSHGLIDLSQNLNLFVHNLLYEGTIRKKVPSSTLKGSLVYGRSGGIKQH